MASPHSDYYSTAEYAKILNITVAGVNKQIREGRIKAEKNKQNNYIIYKKDIPPFVNKKIEKMQRAKARRLNTVDASNTEDLARTLWSAADALRGSVDSSDYKNIVLGLIFLKYLNDAFELQKAKIKEVAKKRYKNQEDIDKMMEDRDRYLEAGVCMVPKNASWEYLQKNSAVANVAEIIDDAMDVIEEENDKELRGVLPKEFVRSGLDTHTITELINIISSVDFGQTIEGERDALGQVYEYFLGQFADAEGKRGGEFYTPDSLVKLLVSVLGPKERSRVFDPACGSGGMFVQTHKFLKDSKLDARATRYYGQESNERTYKLAKMNLVLRGIESKGIRYGNSHTDDKFTGEGFDFVLANPPFNQEWSPQEVSDNDKRIQYGKPRKTNANFFWIQHFISHMNNTGRAGFVMANGSLSVAGVEGDIREAIIEDDLVEVIISCPTKLFYNTGIPCCLWFLSRDKGKRKGEVLFIDAAAEYEEVSRKNVKLGEDNIKKIVRAVDAWRNKEKYEDIPGFCQFATKKEVADKDYILTPGRYIQPAEDKEPFDFKERYAELKQELNEQMREEEKLNKKIQDNLKNIKL